MQDSIMKVSVLNDEGPPVPIPNTEVKLISADNTWLATVREDRSILTPYLCTDKGRKEISVLIFLQNSSENYKNTENETCLNFTISIILIIISAFLII